MTDTIIALALVVPAIGWLAAKAVIAHHRGIERLRRRGL